MEIPQQIPDWKRVLRKLFAKRSARVGGLLFLALLCVAVFAPYLATHDPYKINIMNRLQPPGKEHFLGTDDLGRDLYSRIIYGSRITLQIGFISVSIGAVIGTVLGVFAGYLGGRFDLILMRIVDVLMAFPAFLLALAFVAILGPSLTNAMIAVGLGGIPVFIRTIRSATLVIKTNDYVGASKVQGASAWHIVFKHILPNIISPLIILATMRFPIAILNAAALSFIGLGAQPPTPEWGALLVDARAYIRSAPWVVNYPGLVIMLTGLGFNLVGDALRDALDPKER